MDAPQLPDDPRDWPTDPFALLGVPQSVSEAELKRAYTRLIRKYKPEHAPEEFRRIREAYEVAIEMSRWYRDAPPANEAFTDLPFTVFPRPTPDSRESHRPAQEPPADFPRETQIDPPVRPAAVDPVEDAWELAISRQNAEAYAVLVSLLANYPHRADLPLRLYWLLALRPALDDTRTRHDWLAAALERAHLSGPAVELYRRELETDPVAALYGPYARLLELSGTIGTDLLVVARMRLTAAGLNRRWSVMDRDLTALAPRVPELDEVAWLAHLTQVYGWIAFERPHTTFQLCIDLLHGLKHLELRHSWAFDQLDELVPVAKEWRRAVTVPDVFRWALEAAWASRDDWRKPLVAAATWAAANPLDALLRCDQAVTSAAGRSILGRFAHLVEVFRRDAAESTNAKNIEFPPALIRGLIAGHFPPNRRRDYPLLRGSLLQLMLAEGIDPDEVVSACHADPLISTRILAGEIHRDEVLKLVYRIASVAH